MVCDVPSLATRWRNAARANTLSVTQASAAATALQSRSCTQRKHPFLQSILPRCSFALKPSLEEWKTPNVEAPVSTQKVIGDGSKPIFWNDWSGV